MARPDRKEAKDSFVDLQAAIAGFVPAFAPGQADLEPAAFAAFLTALDAKNLTAAEKEAEWRTQSPAYDGTKGLREKMKSIKESVKSQYGFPSPQLRRCGGFGCEPPPHPPLNMTWLRPEERGSGKTRRHS